MEKKINETERENLGQWRDTKAKVSEKGGMTRGTWNTRPTEDKN